MAKPYLVAIYELDRNYGGPEEGGWWFDSGELHRVIGMFASEDKAYAFARRANHWLNRLCKPKYGRGSMAYEGGEYVAQVYKDNAPRHFPEETPRYE